MLVCKGAYCCDVYRAYSHKRTISRRLQTQEVRERETKLRKLIANRKFLQKFVQQRTRKSQKVAESIEPGDHKTLKQKNALKRWNDVRAILRWVSTSVYMLRELAGNLYFFQSVRLFIFCFVRFHWCTVSSMVFNLSDLRIRWKLAEGLSRDQASIQPGCWGFSLPRRG